MALTKAQQAAWQTAQNQLNQANRNVTTSRNNYTTSRNNYSNAVNQGYKPSQTTLNYRNNADAMLKAARDMGEFSYNSQYTDKITGMLDKAENMKFEGNYSLTDDPIYQNYRDQAVHNGQMAARDAMAQGIANSGGYGSTVAQTAANQAYNESLTKLNDIVPSLYQQQFENQMTVFDQERSTLQNLAAAYQSLDKQTFDQELSTWTNNFNQYVTLSNEYFNRYEYMDSAERAEYETRLNALYNLMTSDQSQYNQDQNLQANAVGNLNDVAQQNASYLEQQRVNNANIANQNAQLDLQRRQLAQQQQSSGNNYGAWDKTTDKSRQNLFRASIMTENEFKRSASNHQRYGSYNEYISRSMLEWIDEGKISQADADVLMDYYKLG